MPTATRTATQTSVVSGGDIRRVVRLMSQEIRAICRAAAHMTRDFDVDSAESDLGLLVLNEVVAIIRLQIYHSDELMHEFRYVIADQPREAWGPPPEQPPLPPVPEGARVRLVVDPNSRIPPNVREGWFRKLNWTTAAPLREPQGAIARPFGVFASGGFAVERRLLTSPKYDRAFEAPGSIAMQKEDQR